MNSGAPVILLAFANDSGEHLPQLQAERNLVSDLLRPFQKDGRVVKDSRRTSPKRANHERVNG